MIYSVVIPMYNSEETIIKAVESVESQTKYELIDEIIIVNDGSSDQSEKIVRDYQKHNKKIVLISKANGGAATARNIGISAAKNDFVALLDADDTWTINKIEIQDKILSDNLEIKALGSNREGEAIFLGKKYLQGVFKYSPTQYCIKNWPCTPSLVFDKSVFESKEYFPEDMTHAEEGLFFLFLAKTCGLYYCADCLVLCGDGKRAFGVSGLSENLTKMHSGVIEMLKRAGDNSFVSKKAIPFLIFYENLKYIRRRKISKQEKK